MASEDFEIDEMDSLFEGMVLFNPCSQIKTDAPSDEQDLENDHHQSSLPPPTTEVSASSSSFEPLDENLFSDLTLIQPQSDSSYTTTTTDVTTSKSTSTVISSREVIPQPQLLSRQISSTRKKKRAGGLRIGYGRERDPQVHDEEPGIPLSSPSPVVEEKDEQREEEEASSSSSSERIPDLAMVETTSAVEDDSLNKTTSTTAERIDPSPTSTIEAISNAEEEVIKQVGVEENSIELRYEQIRAQISQKLNNAREKVVSLSAKRKDSVRRRRKALEDLSLASIKYKEMEKELEKAIESEDFETAEGVSESLVSAERNKQLLAVALRDAEADCDAVDSEMQQVLELQFDDEQDCASLLQSFSMDAAHNADSVLASAESMTSEEMEKWLSSTEALEVKKMELEIESHVVSEAQVVLNDSIEDSVKDDREERELLHKKKEMLTEELERLLALVKQKEAEIAENDSNIEKVEKRISDVVSTFQEAQSSFHSNYNNLLSGLSQLELDNEALSRKKKEIDDFLFKEEARGSKIRELGRISADEASMYQEVINLRKTLVQFISKSREDKARLAMTEEKLSEDVQMLKQEISAARGLLQDLSSTKSRIQQEIESLKQRLLFIDKRVPELESEKKVAATSRNFKEAARIATEAKTLYLEKESLQIKTEESMLELKKLEENISHNVNRLQEIEDQISSKEKELAIARYQRLLLVAGAATAERSAAMELGDLEEADILLGEAQAADSEAKKLQPIYNFNEEEFENVPKHFISMELVCTLGRKQLAELAASAHISSL